jgi:myo-inositol-1-phosphate synthase
MATSSSSSSIAFTVDSPHVTYGEDLIESTFDYHMTQCERTDRGLTVKPVVKTYEFQTLRKVPKTGLMLAG